MQYRGDPPPDSLAPHTATLPAAELARRLTRLDEHQQRVRNEMSRMGQLPRGFDAKPSPEPYLGRLAEPVVVEAATVPGFPWLNKTLKEQAVGEANGTKQPTLLEVMLRLGESCTFEEFATAVQPRPVTRATFGTVHWQAFKRATAKAAREKSAARVVVAESSPSPDVEPVAEPEPVANITPPPASLSRPAPLLTPDMVDVPSVRAVVERAIRTVGIAVLRQTLDEIEAGQR